MIKEHNGCEKTNKILQSEIQKKRKKKRNENEDNDW